MVKVVRIVSIGRGAGKTSLIKELIRRLSSLGVRIAVVKHAHSGIKLCGDSGEVFQVGAFKSMAVSGDSVTINLRIGNAELRVKELINQFLSDADVVIAEGFKWVGDWPAVLLVKDSGEVLKALKLVKGRVEVIACPEKVLSSVEEAVKSLGIKALVTTLREAPEEVIKLMINSE